MTDAGIITKVELYGFNADGDGRRMTVADGTQISKGLLLKFADPRTASKVSTGTENELICGISAMEKEASDGSTSTTVWTNGIFEIQASLAIAVGDLVTSAGDNYVQPLIHKGSATSKAIVVGYALEAADAGEVVNIRVNI